MTDLEFDILDELYFVTSYFDLKEKIGQPDEVLKEGLRALIGKSYIKCLFPDPDTEVPYDSEHFEESADKYSFLATKAGLLSHNTL